MRTFVIPALLVLGALACLTPPAPAASLAQLVSASANIGALAKLSLSPASLLFPDADPDVTPAIPSSTGAIAITAKARTTPGATVGLSLMAADDLRSGMDTIPISALSWTATGSGFVAGTVSRTTSQPVAEWSASGVYTGTQTFSLANSWQRATGTYSVSLVYTLSAP